MDKRRKYSLILMSAVWALAATASVSQAADGESTSDVSTSSGNEFRRFSLQAQFEYGPVLQMKMNSSSSAAGAASSITGRLTNYRALASFRYRLVNGVELAAYGGAALFSKFEGSGTTALPLTISQTWNFDNAPVWGIGIQMDVFKNSRFHFIPSLRFLHTDIGGISGSVSNAETSCSYDFGQNNTSTCTTLGGNTAEGVMRSSFTHLDMAARVELGLDIGPLESPWFTISAGGEEAYSLFMGRSTITPPLSTASAVEHYTFASQTSLGAFGRLTFHPGTVDIGVEGHFLSQLNAFLFVGLNF